MNQKVKKTPKYKNSREILKSEKQNHRNFVSTLDRGWKRCYLTQAAHEMHFRGDKVYCGQSDQFIGHLGGISRLLKDKFPEKGKKTNFTISYEIIKLKGNEKCRVSTEPDDSEKYALNNENFQ